MTKSVAIPDQAPIAPRLWGGGYAVVDWIPGHVTVIYGGTPAEDLMRIAKRFGKRGVICLLLNEKWGGNVFVSSRELAERICEKFAPDPIAACGYAAWANSGHAGTSSKYLAHCLVSGARYAEYAHPHDPGDWERCERFFKCVPEARERFGEMATKSRVWLLLVEAWPEITDAMNAGDRERAYALMSKCTAAAYEPATPEQQ